MKYLFILALLASLEAYCQHTGGVAPYSNAMGTVETFQNIDGRPFFPKQYTDINGTPNMFDDFTASTIHLNDGKVIKGIKMNFDLVSNELLYIDEKGKTMAASPSVIKLVEVGDRKFIPTEAKNTFLEIISTEGKATMFRHSRKVILESKPYNSATIQKTFRTNEDIMLSVNGNMTEVKSIKDLYEELDTEKVKEFAKKEKLKQKSVTSWVKIVDYYNSI